MLLQQIVWIHINCDKYFIELMAVEVQVCYQIS